MLVSIGSIGYLIFNNWFSSARQTTESIAEELNESIYNQIYSFIHVPSQINEANHKIIANGILDINDERLRDKFFVGVLSSRDDEIYSFSYGTADGEYYGARRNEKGVIEIMRNNAGTRGNSWYYSVNDDMTAGDLAVQAGKFDPRTRAWYKAAVETGSPTFSPIYKHFVMDDLTVSFACPIYNKLGELQGVLGTHMLLTDIGTYLKNAVSKYNGYAVILEKGSNTLIANSMGIDNFAVLPDGTLERHSLDKVEDSDFKQAYKKYTVHQDPNFLYEGKDQNIYINVKEIHMEGLDWVVISAIPEGLLITPVVQSIHLTVLLTALALLISLVIYMIITGRLLKPMNNLLRVSEALSSGDLTKRVDIVRNDEIGRISESFNRVADKMQFLINNLEAAVKARTEELHKANADLEENKNQLQLILDSTAEAIYGMDLNGECTFCNISCIKLLGYNSQDELLGKNMHHQIHHTRRDGTPFPIDECRIFQSIKQGKGFEADDEVFWRADGISFDVEYHSYPQIKNGEIIGGVVTFMDITERKQKEAEIQYLSCHDTLTGLYNRRCFEDNRIKIDNPDHLPLSVIFADINGLKMTNDIFGHAAGDELIKKSAEILVRSCRENDIVARVGGDEFIILLPNTSEKNAEKVISRIKSEFLDARVAAIKCSISLGLDTKRSPDQSLDEIMTDAENAMYQDKTMNRKSIKMDIIDNIIETLHSRSARERLHSIAVSEFCSEIGSVLQLSELEINKLKRAGYMHDIGKITLDARLLSKEALAAEEFEEIRQHSVVGYRILNLFDDTLDLAEYVYSHHESWDGSGYPRGLKGEQIPLIARIISIAETYERVLNRGNLSILESKKKAIETIKEGAGKQFDPAIAELFAQMMDDNNR
ncbi:diguanylate cyclase [Desulfoscipio gibsoniae]|uniref:PAS domain S-box/diguanylate cyclase (GGDEF) domain-containing protein n=1 Tax=Desulfoscipio gibsoniae DSM 7213 TaxID=767817 RepID=R4KJP8_9FIRM|nr:diguanylate cyclase [Desulfoscipio gibsoniae]AGL02854.1 PAS domain S-box/diguanylate cyclase (GGDEF) domain-containing protein [Desulfoscipio gibsoniae DSM 7213]